MSTTAVKSELNREEAAHFVRYLHEQGYLEEACAANKAVLIARHLLEDGTERERESAANLLKASKKFDDFALTRNAFHLNTFDSNLIDAAFKTCKEAKNFQNIHDHRVAAEKKAARIRKANHFITQATGRTVCLVYKQKPTEFKSFMDALFSASWVANVRCSADLPAGLVAVATKKDASEEVVSSALHLLQHIDNMRVNQKKRKQNGTAPRLVDVKTGVTRFMPDIGAEVSAQNIAKLFESAGRTTANPVKQDFLLRSSIAFVKNHPEHDKELLPFIQEKRASFPPVRQGTVLGLIQRIQARQNFVI